MKRQKGQDIVEFALLLPIFLLVLCGIIYCGFMFGDYQTVQGIVRNAAREAAVVGHYTESTDPSQPINNYKIIADKYNQILKEQNVITHLYVPDAKGVQVKPGNEIDTDAPENSVGASLNLELTKSDVSFVNYIQNVVGMPTDYVVSCFMYDETTKTNT